jgi:hypothetical protein
MSYRPRELVVRAREAAGVLLATLDHNEMVQRFLDMYAAEFRRPGRADQPGHYREQMETIRRESILVMALRIEGALPTRLKVRVPVRAAKSSKKRKKGKKKSRAKKTIKPAWDLAIPLLTCFAKSFSSHSARPYSGPIRTLESSGAISMSINRCLDGSRGGQ